MFTTIYSKVNGTVVVGTLIVLNVFTTDAAKEVLTKLMKLIGIWTGTSLIVLIIALLGSKRTE